MEKTLIYKIGAEMVPNQSALAKFLGCSKQTLGQFLKRNKIIERNELSFEYRGYSIEIIYCNLQNKKGNETNSCIHVDAPLPVFQCPNGV